MYKNRVENNRKILKIIALLYWERGNSAENGAGKFKINMYFYAEFPRSQDKSAGSSKSFLLFSTLFLYIP